MIAKVRILIPLIVLAIFLAGCSHPKKNTAAIPFEIRLADSFPGNGLTEMKILDGGETYYIHKEVLMDNVDVGSAAVVKLEGRPVIELSFNAEGAAKFADLTGSNINGRLAMIAGGKLLSVSIIRGRVSGGKAIINGTFTPDDAQKLAEGIPPQ